MDKRGVTYSGIPSPEIKQSPIIPLGNVPYHMRKNPTVASGIYLNMDSGKINQLKSHPKLKSKDKEPTPSYLKVEWGWVSTEVDYSSEIDPQPTIELLYNMGNSAKICFWKNKEQQITKKSNELMKIENFHLKNSYIS